MSTILIPTTDVAPNSDAARVMEVDVSRIGAQARSAPVTFAVGATSRMFLVGPAGSGKSLVLDLLSFRALPSRGRVEVLGVDPANVSLAARPRIRRRLGQLFQDHYLLPDIDVFANVALAARIAKRRPPEYTPEVNELLLWVGLGGRGADAISTLTEAERRRLCLARALINTPELLIIDDPTRDLSGKAERQFMRLVIEANEAGTPVIFATRDPSLAANAGGFIYEMPRREVA